MDRATATLTARKNIRSPQEAVRLKLPNPARRSSGMKPLPLFLCSGSATTKDPTTSKTPQPSTSKGPTSNTPSSFHCGGIFLEGFLSHLQTHAGGSRNRTTATQLARDVGKYLHALNPEVVDEARLLETPPIEEYLKNLSTSMGVSGILHRILSHKAAVKFMKLAVSYLAYHCLLICTTVLPQRWWRTPNSGRPTGLFNTCRPSTSHTTGSRQRRGGTCSLREPWRVGRSASRRSMSSAETPTCSLFSDRMPLHSSRATSQGAGITPAWGCLLQG